MIIDTIGMQKIEQDAGYASQQLMEKVGQKMAAIINAQYPSEANIVILCGKGNNGGDGYALASFLHTHYMILTIEGSPKSKEAQLAASKIPTSNIHTFDTHYLHGADLIIDAVYGFSYHGKLKNEIKKIFRSVNALHKEVWSIDINSGAEADTGYCDLDAMHSNITYAIECLKPFHLLKKERIDCRFLPGWP